MSDRNSRLVWARNKVPADENSPMGFQGTNVASKKKKKLVSYSCPLPVFGILYIMSNWFSGEMMH